MAECSSAIGVEGLNCRALQCFDNSTWNPVRFPLPHDWLSQHNEEGQSVSQFLEVSSANPLSRLQAENLGRDMVYLLPAPTVVALICPG